MTVIVTVEIELDDTYDDLIDLESDVRKDAVMWGEVLSVEATEVRDGEA